MRELLNQEFLDSLIATAHERADDHLESLRETFFRVYDDGAAPVGFSRLRPGSQDRRLVESFVMKQAEREQRGVLPGDLNSSMVQHPEFRRMVDEDLRGGVVEPPGLEGEA